MLRRGAMVLNVKHEELDQGWATYICRKGDCKFFEFFQLRPKVYLVLLVQQDREQRLSPASILYDLVCKEKVLRSSMVVAPVFCFLARLFCCRVFEEKYDTINRAVKPEQSMLVPAHDCQGHYGIVP